MAGTLKTLNIYQNGSSIYNASTFTSYGIWTDGNKIYKTNNHTPQSGDTELVTLTTAISGLYHNADGEQVSVGLNAVLVITTLVSTDIIVYCVNASNKTTLDLSTLSDIADGTHTVKVKAKADGYRDSEFSNEVSYTKAPAGYKLTITGSWFETGFPAGASGYFSLDGIDSNGNVKFPRYISTGSNENYVDYEATTTSSSVKKACPLVFENVSKIGIAGHIKINGVADYYPDEEYVLTQDTTFSLGYKDD